MTRFSYKIVAVSKLLNTHLFNLTHQSAIKQVDWLSLFGEGAWQHLAFSSRYILSLSPRFVLAFLHYDQSNGRVLYSRCPESFINTSRKRGCLYAARTVINLTDPIVVSKHYSFGISPILWRRHCKGILRKLLTL